MMTNQQMQYAYWQRMRQQQVYRTYAAGSSEASKTNAYDKIAKVSDNYFLNYFEYSPSKIDSQKAADYLKSLETPLVAGRCTGVYDQSTGRALRQLDWYYNDEAEFIVKMKADPAKGVFGSIGVTAASPKMTVEMAKHCITTGCYYDYFDVLPFFTVDGVNENGIFAQSNVVSKGNIDIDIKKPGATGLIDCCVVMLVRYILDKFSTADMVSAEAVRRKLYDNLHIYGTSKLGGYNPHILVACHKPDLKKSYVIEFTDKKDESCIIVNEFPIMTNFRTIKSNLSAISVDDDYKIDWDEIESDGIGLERWETCAKFLKQPDRSIIDFKELRDQLDYTHAYDRPFVKNVTWLTDNLSGNLSVSDMKEYHYDPAAASRKVEIESALDGYRVQFDRRQRTDKNVTWITTHSTIYDLVNLSCNIKSQMSTGEQTCWNVLSDGTMSEVRTYVSFGANNVDYRTEVTKLSGKYDRDEQIGVQYATDGTPINNVDITYLSGDAMCKCSSIGMEAFAKCVKLCSVNLPNVLSTQTGAFEGCTSLSSVNLPNATMIDYMSFQNCTKLDSISLPNATAVGTHAFSDCTSLTSINLPNLTTISRRIFSNCENLNAISLPKAVEINKYAFENCVNLSTITLENAAQMVTLDDINAFDNLPTDYKIYVPSNLYNDYISDDVWKEISDHITTENV